MTKLTGLLNIPNGIIKMNNNVFDFCTNIIDIIFPSSLIEISNSAFSNCNFTNVNIPEGVQTIGMYAFSACHNLSVVTIPSTVTIIDMLEFSNSFNIVRINAYPMTAPTIGTNAFYGMNKANALHRVTGSTGYDINGWESFTGQITDL